MSEPEELRSRPRGAIWAGALLASLMLYVLSVGPVVWFFSRTTWTPPDWVDSAIGTFYIPLLWMMEQSESFASAIEWYWELGAP